MIKTLLNIILIFTILTSISFAESNNNNTLLYNRQNTSVNIKKAKLLEKYVYNMRENLLSFKNKYDIKGNYEVDQIQKELSRIITRLKKIQSLKIKKDISEKVTLEALRRLKIITVQLKTILKKQKKIFDSKLVKSKLKYVKIANFLSNKIEYIVLSLYKPLKNKKIYSLRESKIITYLKGLLKENNRLKKFKNEKFISEENSKKQLINILKNVKKEIGGLKKIMN